MFPFIIRSITIRQLMLIPFSCSVLVACSSGGSGGDSNSNPGVQSTPDDISIDDGQEPPVVVHENMELLVNADFTNQFSGWETCDGSGSVSIENNMALLNDEDCIRQPVEISPLQEITVTCDIARLSTGNEWAGLGLRFYDDSRNFISEPTPVRISSERLTTYFVTGVAPTDARYADVSIYTTTSLAVSSCFMSGGADVVEQPVQTEPPLKTNFCPTYDESPLYRARSNILLLGPTDEDWEQQIEQAQSNTEVLLADGEYLLDNDSVYMANSDITVRSLSGNQGSVVIRGLGYNTGQSEGFMIAADRITIADMTMHGMRRHAIAMKPGADADGILDESYVYNMNIYDTGTQHIKGADSGENREAVIACSTIGYSPNGVVGSYIGAIGIFEGSDVVVRDNYVYNITGDGTGCNVAEPLEPCIYDSVPAIYMRSSRDSIVERNTVLDSWRGISLGLTNGHVRGIIRNNFVYREEAGDHGISVELSTGTIVEHNTVIVGGYWAPIEVRAGSGHTFRNNLTTLPIKQRDGTFNNSIDGNGNIEYATGADFVAPGDAHLQIGSAAIGAGVAPIEVIFDIDGEVRSGGWDVGADHFSQ